MEIDLSNNPIYQITNDVFLEDLPLTHLNLRNTSLRKIEMNTFKTLQNLNDLNLEWNLLSPVDIQKLEIPGLRTLYLSHNNFTHVGVKIVSNMFDKLRSIHGSQDIIAQIQFNQVGVFNKHIFGQ